MNLPHKYDQHKYDQSYTNFIENYFLVLPTLPPLPKLPPLPTLFSRFPIPDSRFPIPVPLLGGVRGGFRFPIPVPLLGGVRGGFRFPFPSWEGLGVGSDSRSPPGRG
ncbi:hypothetical protein [Moorena sp. SIO3A5]|uniref:hypothetical protein n=1 Tax=Moorena sp. SIO3A5 TaxID=2607822 RepID=UPI0025794D94|nr:hypothetical protein [Moorena sp. SIO3A5]